MVNSGIDIKFILLNGKICRFTCSFNGSTSLWKKKIIILLISDIFIFSSKHCCQELPFHQNHWPNSCHPDLQHHYRGNRHSRTDSRICWRKCHFFRRKSVPVLWRCHRLVFWGCGKVLQRRYHPIQSAAEETQLQVLRIQ